MRSLHDLTCNIFFKSIFWCLLHFLQSGSTITSPLWCERSTRCNRLGKIRRTCRHPISGSLENVEQKLYAAVHGKRFSQKRWGSFGNGNKKSISTIPARTGMFDQSWTDRLSDFLFMFSLLVVIEKRETPGMVWHVDPWMYSVSPRFAFFSREGSHARSSPTDRRHRSFVKTVAARWRFTSWSRADTSGFQAPKPILVARLQGSLAQRVAPPVLTSSRMASWSDVGAGEGSHGHHEGDGANGYDDVGDGQDLPGGEAERGSSAGWSLDESWRWWAEMGHYDRDHSVGSRDLGSTSSRRRRGKRGSGSGKPQQQRWRSGQVPVPPEFDGDVEANSLLPSTLQESSWTLGADHEGVSCLPTSRLWGAPWHDEGVRQLWSLRRWMMSGTTRTTAIKVLLGDLERHFGEKEIYRRGGVIREYETITRVQGESITAFIRRFRLVERKLQGRSSSTISWWKPSDQVSWMAWGWMRRRWATSCWQLVIATTSRRSWTRWGCRFPAGLDFDWHGSTRSFAFFEFGSPYEERPW